MAISSTQSYVEYTGDSSTKSFSIPFYFLLNSDISVMIADGDGNITELTNGTDFSVTGQGVSTGGTCAMNTAYSDSYSILIYREPPETQETKYYENGKFPARSHELALDKLTMLIQRFGWVWDSLALKRPNYFADYYEANGHRIADLQDPTNPQDATTKKYVDDRLLEESEERKIVDEKLNESVSDLSNFLNDEVIQRISGDRKTLSLAENYANTLLAGSIPLNGGTNVGFWVPDAVAIFNIKVSYYAIQVRGFYSAYDGGQAVWVSTGNTDTSKSGTHVPASAKIYNANGVEYQLHVQSGSEISAKANGLKTVESISNIADETEDFVCTGEVINGITSIIKNYKNENDNINYLKVTVPNEYPLRLGKASIKAYSSLALDFQLANIYVYPSPSNFNSVTGIWMNAIERGIEDIKNISTLYSGKASYGDMTLTDFHLIGGRFYGDHVVTKSYKDCNSGTGLMAYNIENSSVTNTLFKNFAVSRQYVRTVAGYYYDNLGNKVTGTLVPEVATASTGSYEGMHETNVMSYGARMLHLRTVSNWAKFDKCIFGSFNDWTSSPDGSQFDYFIENIGAGVVFSGGSIGASVAGAGPLKGIVRDTARGCTFEGVYYEYPYAPGWVIAKPDSVQNYRGTGLFITNLGSYYSGKTAGYPLIAFEDGFFGEYNSTGYFQPAEWENGQYYAFAGPTTWSLGQPSRDLGAFPNGGFDFKYGTLGIHYSGDVPDVDSLRDTINGNEFLSPYGLQVNSGNLLFPLRSPAHKTNIVVWYKDLTGNFDPTTITVSSSDNINATGATLGRYYMVGMNAIDYGNGYKAAFLSYVNPRPLDNRMSTSAGLKLAVPVTNTAPIILKNIEAYEGGIPIFPTGLSDYVPKSQLDRVWGTMASSSTDPSAYYSNSIGGGIFKPGDVVSPFLPFTNATARSPATYTAYGQNGTNTETRVVTGGAAWGGGLTGKSIDLTVVSEDSTNGWTTVSVPDDYAAYVFAGMPLYITANSGGGKTGEVNIIQRVANSDGTLANSYVLEGLLGSAGVTLTISTTKSYTFGSGVSQTITGVSGGFSTGGGLTCGSGDFRIGYGAGNSSARLLRMYYDGTNVSGILGSVSSNGMYLTADGGLTLNGNLLSSTGYSFGTVNAYPANIFSQTAVTVVSDADKKLYVEKLTDAEISLAKALAKLYRTYKLKDAVQEKGDAARTHFGTIAQLVVQAFTDAGLDWKSYGVVTYESWDAAEEVTATLPAITDDDGNVLQEESTIVVTPARDAGEIYMVRYDELNSLIIAGQEARLEALENK